MMARAMLQTSPLFWMLVLVVAAQTLLFWAGAAWFAFLFRVEFGWVGAALIAFFLLQLALLFHIGRLVRRDGWRRAKTPVLGYLIIALPPMVVLAIAMGR